jgi:hypothetical protein
MADDMDPKVKTRRSALGLGVASVALAAGAAAGKNAKAAQTRLPIRFDDPVWNRETAARLQADTDGSQVYGYSRGVVTGVRPGEAVKPLFDFQVFSTIRVLRQADGNYQRMTKEVVFYTDLKTGAILDKWTNPYTGETVDVVDIANDPYNWVIASTVQPPPIPGVPSTGQAVPGGKPFLQDWSTLGPDTVVLTQDGHGYYPNLLKPAQWPRESSGTMIQASEFFRYFINRADLENPDMTFLPANGSWVRVTPWLPWMLMGQAPGHILYDGIFRASKSLDYVPAPVLQRVHTRYPQYLMAPTKWYGPSYSSLEHYAMERKPAPPK